MLQKKNCWIFLIILTILTNSLLADPVIFLDKDKPAPFDGYLFSPKDAKDLRLKLIDNDINLEVIKSYQKSLSISDQINSANEKKINLCVTQVETLSKTTVDEREFSDWKKLGWFTLGVLTSILTVYGIKKVTQ